MVTKVKKRTLLLSRATDRFADVTFSDFGEASPYSRLGEEIRYIISSVNGALFDHGEK